LITPECLNSFYLDLIGQRILGSHSIRAGSGNGYTASSPAVLAGGEKPAAQDAPPVSDIEASQEPSQGEKKGPGWPRERSKGLKASLQCSFPSCVLGCWCAFWAH